MKKFLPVVILSLFVMTACNGLRVSTPTPTGSSESVAEQVEHTSLSDERDALDAAGDLTGSIFGSGLKCSDLKEPKNREVCEIELNNVIGNMLLAEISARFDAERCKELPEPLAFDCESSLLDTGVEGPVTEEELITFNQIIQGDLPALNGEGESPPLNLSYDSSKCAQLTTVGYKEYCEERVDDQLQFVIFDEITLSGDSDRCDELREPLSLECKQFFGIDVPLTGPIEAIELGDDDFLPEGIPANAAQ